MDNTLRIALIGAGTICRTAHAPCLTRLGATVSCVLDPNPNALASLKPLLPDSVRYINSGNVLDTPADANCAIVCTPAAMHFEQVHKLLTSRRHVFCEKPLACDGRGAQTLLELAHKQQVVLQVGFYRRFHPTHHMIKGLITSGSLGPLKNCIIKAGHILSNPSPLLLDKSLSGGGMLMDFGVHIIDRLYSWFDDLKLVQYSDDAQGGVEANAVVDLNARFQGADVPTKIMLSWTNELGYECMLMFEQATITVPLNAGYEVHVQSPQPLRLLNQQCHLSNMLTLGPANSAVDYFCEQWQEFSGRVHGGAEQKSNLKDAVRTSRLVEQCYASREMLELSWGM